MKKIRIAVLGAGMRGADFAQSIRDHFCQIAEVVAVAEPRQPHRDRFAQRNGLPPERVFERWEDFAAQPPMCDAVAITTQDRGHVGPALACMEKGYHILLEKPMAPTLEECRTIAEAQAKSGSILAVCHSLRYQKGFAKVKQLIEAGKIGRLMSMDQLEQVQFEHQSHSYVRGNWGNEGRSACMLLAKSCHDIDYMTWLADAPCLRVSSFGHLSYFKSENAPAGATARCTDPCPLEPSCPYSALRLYLHLPEDCWPASVVCPSGAREDRLEALRTGPYGRCVWHCDNDVVDHQVVLMEFDRDITATFTMTAFAQAGGRRVRVHGTEADISFNEESLELRTFADKNTTRIDFGADPGGHGGGDRRVVMSWLEAIRRGDPSLVLTGARESLRTHGIVFAAERSRHERRMVELSEFSSILEEGL